MIEYFAYFGEEDWMGLYTDKLKTLIEKEKKAGNNGIIKRTYCDGVNKIYFMMTDRLGHTYFYRMKSTEFHKQMKKLEDEE